MSKKQIISQLPGIFYRKASPESPNYKNNGDIVNENDVIGLIEVMKSFHEVRSDVSGTVTAFIVKNEGLVMPGDVILEVE